MKNPQTLAEKLYQQFPTAKLKSISKYACCAFTFMWCMGYEPDDAEAILTVGYMIDKGALDTDCTVYWTKVSEYISGKKCKVDFIDLTDKKQLMKIKERTPVKFERTYYDKNGNEHKSEHWVGVENGKIEFNSLKESLTVAEGNPVTMRKITYF